MTLADLFDNRLWETYQVDAAPKRGGTVERRRYIGKNPMTMEFTGVDYGPTQSGSDAVINLPSMQEVPEFIATENGWIRNPDLLGERFRNRDTAGPVTLAPTDSLDKQDMLDVAGRDYGIHGNERPLYDTAAAGREPETSIADTIADAVGTAQSVGSKVLDWGAPVWESVGRGWDWANQPLAQPTTLSPQAEEARRYGKGIIPSRDIGTADRAIIDQNIRNIREQFVSDRIKQEYAKERARYQELVDQGMDEVTAAIMAGREFKRATGETKAERSPDQKKAAEASEKFDLLRFLQGLGSAYLGKRL